jgi:hypothetical protein
VELIGILRDIFRQVGSHLGPILKFVIINMKSLIICIVFSITRVVCISLVKV